MERENLSISVIIPVYNGERFLVQAIENIQEQNYQPLEIIVVDDGSTDRTAEIAAEFQDKIHYIYQTNQGPSSARNHGIENAKGEAIAFLDVDDLWDKGVLTEFADYLVAHPQVGIVQGLIQQMQMETVPLDNDSYQFKPIFQPYQFINLGSALYRRSVFHQVGLFDPKLHDNEDTDWFIRAWENNIHKVVIPRIMLYYRKHERNITLQQQDLVHFGMLKIYKRHIDRLRSQGKDKHSPSVSWQSYCGQPPA
ncbi:glycosyltransferase family A protein [Dolichospermum sp. UHCC 0259]|uniref:glycosyltransferase family 2 protein n=1 Tax=Dolichospermum sp. UHCC 0259 TaxID=2590010 RepID=UPI0014475906|nr:glycosyltransferase family A protein [Dolichospermum sp. UHCC 0259]MTJ50057.1 glycosyltransferase family 2 protein [Dolichospermum sp. UHCC 0259]